MNLVKLRAKQYMHVSVHFCEEHPELSLAPQEVRNHLLDVYWMLSLYSAGAPRKLGSRVPSGPPDR